MNEKNQHQGGQPFPSVRHRVSLLPCLVGRVRTSFRALSPIKTLQRGKTGHHSAKIFFTLCATSTASSAGSPMLVTRSIRFPSDQMMLTSCVSSVWRSIR